MRYRPTFEEFVELARGATVVPVYRQLIGDTLTPVSRFLQDPGGRLGVPVRERRRRRTPGPLQLPRRRPVPPFPGVRQPRPDPDTPPRRHRRPGHAGARPSRPAAAARGDAGRLPRPARCLACRASAAGRSVMPATTPSATSSVCRTRRPTTAACPICASPSTTAWSSSTTSTRPSPSWPTPTSAAMRTWRDATRRRVDRVDRLVERLHQGVADLQLTDISPIGRSTVALSHRTSRPRRSRPRWTSARSTSRPATSSRWCSASACRPRRRPGRSTSTAPCAWSTRARSCSISRPARCAWSARRRRSCAGSRATA